MSLAAITLVDDEVVVANGHIERRWRLTDHGPVAVSLRDLVVDHEWLTDHDQPALVAPHGRLMMTGLASLTVSEQALAPLAEPGLHGVIELPTAHGPVRWHVHVHADEAAISQSVEWPVALADTDDVTSDTTAGDAPGPTGIEGDEGDPLALPEVDRCEAWALAAAHPRLLAWDLQDRTDLCGNLVHRREWLAWPMEAVRWAGCLTAIDDAVADRGLSVIKRQPLPARRPVAGPPDLAARGRVWQLHGHGCDADGAGDTWTVVLHGAGSVARSAALQQHQRAWRPGRDGEVMSNTWGDRSRDAVLSESFALAEIAVAAELGVDVVQLDDGWQGGVTANSIDREDGGVWEGFWAANADFWQPHPQRFPNGLAPMVAAAAASGVGLGLWYAPDSSDDFANWQRDRDTLLALHREHGVVNVKFDGIKLRSRLGQQRLTSLCDAVVAGSDGACAIDLDVTAETRPGWFGLIGCGPVFVQNRYTDWANYHPLQTLRSLWQLSAVIAPQRLRFEVLNPERNGDAYSDDPLAPANWPADCLAAITLVAAPLVWAELQHLSSDTQAAFASVFRERQRWHAAWQQATIVPIGDDPAALAWCGFAVAAPGGWHVIAFRLYGSGSGKLVIPALAPDTNVAANGPAQCLAGEGDGRWAGDAVSVSVPSPLGWVWLHWPQ